MPTKRKPVYRNWRPGRFSAEAVELFAALEHTPGGNRPYTDDSLRLAGMLGLTNEWLSSCHVNDRSERPCWPPSYVAHDAFWKVREVRQALLAVCAQRAGEPKAETAQTQATERAQARELETAAAAVEVSLPAPQPDHSRARDGSNAGGGLTKEKSPTMSS
jgi:hypothetical protein